MLYLFCIGSVDCIKIDFFDSCDERTEYAKSVNRDDYPIVFEVDGSFDFLEDTSKSGCGHKCDEPDCRCHAS